MTLKDIITLDNFTTVIIFLGIIWFAAITIGAICDAEYSFRKMKELTSKKDKK